MQTLKACSCPRCHFFLGYSTTQPSFNHRRTTIIGACLNCDYQPPIRALLRGQRPPLALPQRAAPILKAVEGLSSGPKRFRDAASGTVPRYCARELRAVGQTLEQLQVKNFNLRRVGQSYLIWDRDSIPSPRGAKPTLTSRLRSIAPNYQLNRDDIERIERDGKSRRSQYFYPVNGHKLSHLLRTLGAQTERRGQLLLGVIWRDDSVRVVVETQRGRRHVEQIRTDILYDLWVRMYLRRAR